MKLLSLALLTSAIFNGCSEPSAPTSDTCGASQFENLLGKSVSQIDLGELPQSHRVIGPTTAITKDLRPNRLNLIVDENDKVMELKCF